MIQIYTVYKRLALDLKTYRLKLKGWGNKRYAMQIVNKREQR